MRMALTPMIPPMARLPVSPMNTWAGYELYQRKPQRAPTNTAMKMATSPVPGMNMMFRYSEFRILPLSQARIPMTTPTMAEVPAASPSIPSVRLVPLEQAVMTMTIIST